MPSRSPGSDPRRSGSGPSGGRVSGRCAWPTTASGCARRTPNASSGCSSAWIVTVRRGRAWGWHCAARSSSATAGASGSRPPWARGRRCTSPCPPPAPGAEVAGGRQEERARAVADILLVDDRPENLVALQAVLRPLGHNLVTAGSGEEALRRLLTEDFAVILLDVLMPGMDGFETAFQIKQRDKTRDVPIIFLTAISRDESDVLQGFSSGAVDYVTKPYEGWLLRAKVHLFAERHQKTELLKQQRELLATRLDERYVQEARQLRKLADASLTLTSTLAVDSILDAVTTHARDIIGAHHAQTTVFLGEDEGEAGRRTSAAVAVSPEYEGWAASREGVQASPLAETVAPRQRPMRVARGQAASRPEGRALATSEPRHPALQGWLAVPLAGPSGRA